jgi:transcriptional regulator with XRE-family HTH domain
MMIDLVKQLGDERKKRKMSVETISRAVGCSNQTGYNFFQGKPINTQTLEKILNYFGAEIILKYDKK